MFTHSREEIKMSICFYGRINKRCINEDLLEKFIADFFAPSNEVVKQRNKGSVKFEGFSDDDKIVMSFVNEKKPPYNVYDSNIIGSEYEYIQLIIFDVNKIESTIDTYKEIINFCIYIRKRIEGDILITSDVYDDICLLKKQEKIWPENPSPMFKSTWF